MSLRWADITDVVRSYIAANWNAKTAMITASVSVTGIALVILWKRRKAGQVGTRTVREYHRRMAIRKRELFDGLKSLKDARGDGRLIILEIGCGAGMNFGYYPDGSEVICVEPNRQYETLLYDSARQHPEVQISAFVLSSAENMPEVKQESVDAVVSTIVFCCVDDPDQCLREVVRVLKPGGKLFVMEHVKASAQCYVIRFLQVLFNVPWSIRHRGCRLTRRTQEHIRKAGFSRVDVEEFEAYELMQPPKLLTGVRLIRPHISGTATK